MKEANMQTFWGKHLKLHPPKESEVHELKFSKTGRIAFKAVPDHQIKALLEAKHGCLYHKITDQTWGYNPKHRFTHQKPFDSFCVVKVKAYVVMWFYVPRTKKKFIKMDIDRFLQVRKKLDRKSLTEQIAIEEGGEVVELDPRAWRN